MKQWLRKKLREFLGIGALQDRCNYFVQEVLRLEGNQHCFERFLDQMRKTTFAGATNDGIKNELIIINHDTITNEWKIVYDNGLRSQTYMGLVRELREKLKLYNARYVAVNAGDNMLDIKARMALDTQTVPESPELP